MDKTVRNFKYTILGGRFSGFVAAIAVIVMRVLMFLNGDIPQNEFSDSSFVWKFLAPFFSDPRVSFGASRCRFSLLQQLFRISIVGLPL